jgi:NAD(P)-dependent dehydrogenase (short-subunit alcohol dehydrogenase family)
VTRRVLITAGANGIGLVMARAFAAAGDRVWVTDVDAAAVASVPDGIRATRCDASIEAQMIALFAEIAGAWGGLDVLCANAGIKGPTAGIEEMDLAEWHACLAVNLDGAMIAAKHAARMMKPAGSGVMIFTSSTSGLYGTPFRAPYVAAKWGVIGLMKTVAMELGPHGIRANAICPGTIQSPSLDERIATLAKTQGITEAAARQAFIDRQPMGRLGTAEEMAALAVYLASDESSYTTGQIHLADGGFAL